MPSWLADALKLMGFSTPLIYAASTYGFCHWLDKRASASAKKAISNWLQPKEYDKGAFAAAIVEIFDRLYTRPLLAYRAFGRSAFITICVTGIFLYEYGGLFFPYSFISFVAVAVTIASNILSDYAGLFVIRRFLIVGAHKPILASFGGPIVGAIIVTTATLLRDAEFTLFWDYQDNILNYTKFPIESWRNLSFEFSSLYWTTYFVAAMVVHCWLPLFVVCTGILWMVNYLRSAIGWTQWLLKEGSLVRCKRLAMLPLPSCLLEVPLFRCY